MWFSWEVCLTLRGNAEHGQWIINLTVSQVIYKKAGQWWVTSTSLLEFFRPPLSTPEEEVILFLLPTCAYGIVCSGKQLP